ncbi:MAG TPA: phage holin family protein [Micromonosporaceae bacterium]|jgi:hypothetical protein
MATADSNGSASTAELVNRATTQLSTLVRDELELAKVELIAKGKRAGIGGGLFGGAAALALYGLGLVLVLAVVALDLVWPLWLAVLVVSVVVFAAAGMAALLGKRQISNATPPVPSEAIDSVSTDVHTIKNAIHDGRQS